MTTIKDVAKKAGVSIATVSRVINNEQYVTDKVRNRVNSIIEQMDYKVDAVARGLRTKSTNMIALVIPDINNPFFSEVSRGIQSIADKNDYIVVLCNTDKNAILENKFINILTRQKVGGIIINPSGSNNKELRYLKSLDIPVVLITSQSSITNFDVVSVDNIQGVELAIHHLYQLGHRKIGLVGGTKSLNSGKERYKGFVQSMTHHDLEIYQEFITEGPFTHQGGYECMKEILSEKEHPTAVFASNDVMAIGAMAAVFENGLKIPDDISIVGFDNISLAKMVYPKLTTINQPKYEMGVVATELLFHRMKEKVSSQPERAVLEHELVIRDTTIRR